MENPHLNTILKTLLEIRAPFGAAEQDLSLALYRRLALGEPVSPQAVAQDVGFDRARVERTLASSPGIYRDEAGHVIGYWGLTVAETPHHMLVDGRRVYAWCAWDTLFLPELLGSPVRVESRCPVSGARVALEITPEGVACEGAPPPVSFILADAQKAAADVVRSFCHYVHFFADESGAREWSAAHPGTVLATLEEAWELGRRRNAAFYPGRRFGFLRERGDATALSNAGAPS